MSDKPILFSGAMVRAQLAGTKTQTRRLLTLRGHKVFSEFQRSDTPGYDWTFRDADKRWHDLRHVELLKRLRFAKGDRLWVEETSRISGWDEDGEVWLTYAADETRSKTLYPDSDDFLERLCARVEKAGAETGADGRYQNIPPGALVRPASFMPRWASRLTLHVTDVRVQRLHYISEADAKAEGLQSHLDGDAESFRGGDNLDWKRDPIEAYMALWDSINGAGSWEANPWVAAYTFTVERCNIADARAAA